MCRSWILWISFSLFTASVCCQTGLWTEVGEVEYHLSTGTKFSYSKAKQFCLENDGYLASPKTIEAQNDLKGLVSSKGTERFYISARAELMWDDDTELTQKMLENQYFNSSKHICATLVTTKGKSIELQPCVSEAGFICERNRRNNRTRVGSNDTSNSLKPKIPNPNATEPSVNKSTPSSENLVFSLDLISFLIGMAVPIPFLLAALIKILCSASCFRDEKKSTRKFSNSSSAAVTSHSHGADITVPMEGAYEPAYVNVEIRYSRSGRQYNDGYERPIRAHSEEYIEPATYEDYEFTQDDSFS